MLVTVCGLPGSGKSTVAGIIRSRLEGLLLRSDVIRHELFPIRTYSSQESDAVYAELFRRAKEGLAEQSVVLDAVFIKAEGRETARLLAEEEHADYRLVYVACLNDKEVRHRLEQRRDDVSEATFKIYTLAKSKFEPITGEHIAINNSGNFTETVKQINHFF